MSWGGGIKRDKIDIILSKLVREAANHICQHCGLDHSGCTGKNDAAHVFGRRTKSTRYHSENLICLCKKCHQWFTENPILFEKFCKDHMGEARLDELCLRHNKPRQYKKWEKDEMYHYYKGQYGGLLVQRADGFTKQYEVIPYD